MEKHILLKVPAALILVLALASCGGGGGGDGDSGSDGRAQATSDGQPVGGDSFLSRITALIQSMSDTTEPENIDSVTVTTPETSEPEPVS